MEFLVVPSFTRVGLQARRLLYGWRALEDYRLPGQVALVTGATSGIGLAAATALARSGARVILLGRDAGRLERARQDVERVTGVEVSTVLASMDSTDDIRRAVQWVRSEFPRLDILVHNAGALADAYRRSPMGVEQTSAVQVAGPFLMTGLLLDRLVEARGRVVTVSSGGAYLAPLTVTGLDPRPDEQFNGSRQYARAKRAQITLAALWAQRLSWSGVAFHVMHPGWVDTPGVRSSLPRFRRLLRPLLRTPMQGADTVVWLAADDEGSRSSGRFWLDRAPRPAHRLRRTRQAETGAERARLWAWCERTTGWTWPGEAAEGRG